ncbi:hypothetical_protein [Leishmania braziliensis MHOM/BR/75/M2904]|nr:hypothetical_protein [Leishmania braziliensis MHOM/BR/75/M2904]
MSEVAHEDETPDEGVPVAGAPGLPEELTKEAVTKVLPPSANGVHIAVKPPAAPTVGDGFTGSATDSTSKMHPSRTVRFETAASYMRISSRPSIRGVYFHSAAKTVAAAFANSGTSHAVPYKGTVVRPPSRGPASQSGVRPSAAEVTIAMQLVAEKEEPAKTRASQTTDVGNQSATPATSNKVPALHLTPAHWEAACGADAAHPTANGSEAGAAKKTSGRRRGSAKAAWTEGGPQQQQRAKAVAQVAVNVTKAKKAANAAKKVQVEEEKCDTMKLTTRPQDLLRKKATATKAARAAAKSEGSAAAVRKESLNRKSAEKISKATVAAKTEGAEHGATEYPRVEEQPVAAAAALAEPVCTHEKEDSAAEAEYAGPEVTDAEEMEPPEESTECRAELSS